MDLPGFPLTPGGPIGPGGPWVPGGPWFPLGPLIPCGPGGPCFPGGPLRPGLLSPSAFGAMYFTGYVAQSKSHFPLDDIAIDAVANISFVFEGLHPTLVTYVKL